MRFLADIVRTPRSCPAKLNDKLGRSKLIPTKCIGKAFNKTVLPLLGVLVCVVQYRNEPARVFQCCVIDHPGCLLGRPCIDALFLFKRLHVLGSAET